MANAQALREGGNAFGIVTDGADIDPAIVSGGVVVEDDRIDPHAKVDIQDTTGGVVSDQPTAEVVAAREEAARYNWQDREAWVAAGKDPARWRDAPEFLDVRRGVARIAQEENVGLRSKVAALEAIVAAREAREADANSRISTANLEIQLKDAVEAQDTPSVVKLTRQIAEQAVHDALARRPAGPAQPDAATQARFATLTEQYPWMKQGDPRFDAVMTGRVLREVQAIAQTQKLMGIQGDAIDGLNEAIDTIKRRYPEKFNMSVRRTNGNGAPMVDMGGTPGLNGGGSTTGRTWSDLLPENRRIAEQDIRAGRYTQKQYLSMCTAEDFRH